MAAFTDWHEPGRQVFLMGIRELATVAKADVCVGARPSVAALRGLVDNDWAYY